MRRPGPAPLRTSDQSSGVSPGQSLRFDAKPHVDPAVVHTLAKCDWVRTGLPLCLIGDSGTGKSHLLIALGTEATMAGFRVRYVLATKLVNELVEAADEKILAKTTVRYGRVDLLCTDELGYLELDKPGAELLSRSSPSARRRRPSRSPPTKPSRKRTCLREPVSGDAESEQVHRPAETV
jgi:IstB-like ATP binding protein